jgi:carbonic anhydrase
MMNKSKFIMNMKKKILFGATLLCAFFLAASAWGAHWSYEGSTGPEHWGALNPDYGAAIGNAQSPIDITTSAANGHGKELLIHYSDGFFTIINNGHTIQCAPIALGENYITLDGEKYELSQFHFHVPSEHAVDGVVSDMELHLVHRSAAGRLAVMALLFDKGAANEALGGVWGEIVGFEEGTKPKPLKDVFAIAKLLPDELDNIQYNGSLTTPPTSEGVLWIVLRKRAQASPEQFSALGAAIGHNARPAQPLNNRQLYRGDGKKD